MRPRPVIVPQPENDLAPTNVKLGVVAYLTALVATVVGISFYVLMKESIRLDEAQSIWQTSHSLTGTLKIVAQDVHMPMYHILLHYWMIVFGTGIETVRSMSLLFFTVSIPVAYLLARTVLTRKWSLTITTLFALSPFVSWYGSEARMYTLLMLFSLLSQYFFVRILQKKSGWGGYALTAIIGVYSHYFFAFNLIAQGLFYLFNRQQFEKGTFKKFMLTAIGIVAAAAPWLLYFVREGLASNTRPILQTPSTVDFFNTFSQFLFGFQTDAVNTIILSAWPLLVILAFFAVKRGLKITSSVSYLLFAAFLPIIIAFAISVTITPFFVSRYMLPAVGPLYIVIAWLVSQYPKRVGAVIVGAWFAILGITFYLQTTSPLNPVREDYHTAASYVSKNASYHDVVAVTSPFTVYPFEYYYNGQSQIKTIPLWDRAQEGAIPPFNTKTLPTEVNKLIKGHDYIYVLASHDQGYEKQVIDYFKNHYKQTYEKVYSDDLTLFTFQVGYNDIPKVKRP